MAKYSVIIADLEQGYIQGLSRYLILKGDNEFTVNSFTKEQYLKEYLEKSQVDILLISPEMFSTELNLSNTRVIILNIEDRIPSDLVSYPYINKYQAGNIISKELVKILSEYSDDELVEENNGVRTQLIGVYSPIGGVGKTTISIALSKT